MQTSGASEEGKKPEDLLDEKHQGWTRKTTVIMGRLGTHSDFQTNDVHANEGKPRLLLSKSEDISRPPPHKPSGKLPSFKPGFKGSPDLKKAFRQISKPTPTKHLLLGTVLGYFTGYATMKVSRTAALFVGSSLILVKLAQHKGLIDLDVKSLQSKAAKKFDESMGKNKGELKNRFTDFVKKHEYFSTGFAGGFLIGISL